MGQVVTPQNGEIYIVKLRLSGRVWIFESDYNATKGLYTSANMAFCYDCNKELDMQDMLIPRQCIITNDNSNIQWMRLANDREKFLLKMHYEARKYS